MKRRPTVVAAIAMLVVFSVTFVAAPHADTTSNLRINLVSSLYLGPTDQHSDIWVWEDPMTIKRYAVIGEYPSTGANMYIIEVTNPASPVLVSTITNAPAFDMKVRYPYLYAVNGGTAPTGGAIYDITDPANPTLAAGMKTSHNVTIAENGYIYYSIAGVAVSDLNPDPINPHPIWDDDAPVWYFGHDVTVAGDIMFDFAGYSQLVNVYDIAAFNADTTQAPVLLNSFYETTKMTYPHNGWPSADGSTLYVTDELSPADQPDLLAWDISDIGNMAFTPTIVDEYMDEDATVHNAMVLNDLLYVSYYSAGVRVFDISDPQTMKLIDEYDTSAFTGDGYVGAWGVHCLFGDYFYVSDMENGLYIFELAPAPSLWKDCGVALAADAAPSTLVSPSDPEPDYSVPDGSGGAIVLFDPEGGDRDIYAQRVDVNGNCLWGPDGVPVVDVTGDVTFADAIADSSGGVIVLWTDPRSTPLEHDAYAQWLDASGAPKFAANGLLVSSNDSGDEADAQALQLIDADEFVAVYNEKATIASTAAVYCQRFDDTGTPQWASPTRASLALSNQQHADVCADGTGGVVVVWDDNRNGTTDIFAQRIDAGGVRQNGLGGLAIAASTDPLQNPRIVYVDGGDVTMAWTHTVDPDTVRVEAAELSESDVVSWASVVAGTNGDRRDLQIAFDGSDGVYLVWEDSRSTNWDIYAMHLHGSGGPVAGWTADGEPMATTAMAETGPTLAATDGGMIAAWSYDPSGDGTIQARMLDTFAAPVWPGGTLDLCADADTATSPSIVTDDNGDAIVAWRDTRPEGVFAQRIESSCGTLGGNVPPLISQVVDTSGDGGGYVDVTWDAAGQDGAGMVVQSYDILYAENPQYGWNPTGVSVSASGQASYTATVPAVQDGSTTWFLVVANGGVSTCTWESLPASGVSADDPPAAPQGLQVTQQGNYYNLTWFPPDPVAPDFSHYVVLRGVVAGGSPSAAAAAWAEIGQTTEESFRAETATPGPAYEWTVQAVDIEGNMGALADPDTISDTVSDVATPSYPDRMLGTFPNPFAYTTELNLSLSKAADVAFNVYDVLGRRVAGLDLGRLQSGPHTVPFDGSNLPSGIYFYRTRIGERTFTGKMAIRR